MVPLSEPRPNELVLQAKVNGHHARLVLDTGDAVPGITFPTWFAHELGLAGAVPVRDSAYGVNGKVSNIFKATAQSVMMGPVQVQNLTVFFGAFTTPRDQPDTSSFGEADGYIGEDFLRKANAIVDLQNKKLYLRPSVGARGVALGPALLAAGMAEAPFLAKAGAPCVVNVEINGTPAKMILDTGAFLTMVDARFAAQAHLTGFRSRLRSRDVAGVKSDLDRAVPRTLKVGGVPVHPLDVTISETLFYSSSHGQIVGLLGLDFLGQSWSIIDFGQSRIYFSPLR